MEWSGAEVPALAGGNNGAPFSAYSFVARQKSKTSGGTRPAGFGFLAFTLESQNQGQGRGVAPPHDTFISLFAQRNEAKKCARPPCPSGSLHSALFCGEEKNSAIASNIFLRNPRKADLHSGCVTREWGQKGSKVPARAD